MKKPLQKIISFFIILMILLKFYNNIYSETPELGEGSFILTDAKTGEVLYTKNANMKHLYPASTTKIMTAILAIERGNLDTLMTASLSAINDIGKDGSNIGIMEGEQVSLRSLLMALLISSANETANIIAENICATRQDFVDLMNQKAKELGAMDTHFTNPCGAHNPDHYSTAADMAIIAAYAMSLPEFRKIVKMTTYQLPPTNKHESWPVLATTNKLMQYDNSESFKIIGVKTGYTVPAGFNLVSAAVNTEGMELISVVMNIKGEASNSNVKKYSKELLDYGFANYSEVILESDNRIFSNIKVKDANDELPLDLLTKGEVRHIMPLDAALWNKEVIPHIRENIAAPVNKGDILGYVEYKSNGRLLGKVELIASRQVDIKPQAKVMNAIEELLENGFIRFIVIPVVMLLFFFLLLRLILRTISRKINASKRRKIDKI